MNRRIVLGIVVVLVLIVGAVAAGGLGFRLGVMQGLAANPSLAAPQGNGTVAPFYGAPYFYGYGRPWGWGFPFGFLGCLFPLLGILLVFFLIRGLFWRGGWGGRHGWGGRGWDQSGYGPGGHDFGPGGQGVPPMFAEWHKRAHTEPQPQGPQQPAQGSGQ